MDVTDAALADIVGTNADSTHSALVSPSPPTVGVSPIEVGLDVDAAAPAPVPSPAAPHAAPPLPAIALVSVSPSAAQAMDAAASGASAAPHAAATADAAADGSSPPLLHPAPLHAAPATARGSAKASLVSPPGAHAAHLMALPSLPVSSLKPHGSPPAPAGPAHGGGARSSTSAGGKRGSTSAGAPHSGPAHIGGASHGRSTALGAEGVVAPARVDIVVHGHQLHRPRVGTATDVLTSPEPGPHMRPTLPPMAEATRASPAPPHGAPPPPLGGRRTSITSKSSPAAAALRKRRMVALRGALTKHTRHMEALQLLGVGTAVETVFLLLVAAFGVAVLFLTTIQSISEAIHPPEESAVCSGS